MEIGQHEILFAQKLSCGEPGIRKKAFNRLEKWMKARSVKNQPFTRDDFLKLWKGLYYCLWQQDKLLNQEDLTDNMTKLLEILTNKDQKILFVDTFLEEMAKDWQFIDQWRMDKFMMLFRRFFRRILAWLKGTKWNSILVSEIFDVFHRTVWNPCPESYPEGLKMHFVSFYLDELDNAAAGEFSSDQSFLFLEPYLGLLKNKSLSDVCFESILSDVFKLLLEYSVDLMEKKEQKNSSKSEPALEFDMKRIKIALFDAGKTKSTPRRRRSTIYSYVKQFDLLINGYDPFYEELSPGEELLESDVDNAAEKLVKMSNMTKKRKAEDEDETSDDTDGETEKFIQSKRRKKFTLKKKRKPIRLDKLRKKKPSKKKPKK